VESKIGVLIILGFLALVTSFAYPQAPSPPEDGRTLELVDQLKDVIQRAENARKADPSTIQQLKEIVRQYDWPWRVRLLDDDFSDGEYASNPVWTVNRGDFWVTRGLGLRTVVGAQPLVKSARLSERWSKLSKLSSLSQLGGIFREIPEPVDGTPLFRDIGARSQISTRLALGNRFAIRVRMISREKLPAGSRVEFGPFRGSEQDWGFRVSYSPAQRSAIELLRISPGRASILATFEGADLEDGKAHDFDWRRDRDGNMLVLLDGREVIRAIDRSLSDFFDGFTIANTGGDYTFERVEIFGTAR
jgi:hypothetical protein